MRYLSFIWSCDDPSVEFDDSSPLLQVKANQWTAAKVSSLNKYCVSTCVENKKKLRKSWVLSCNSRSNRLWVACAWPNVVATMKLYTGKHGAIQSIILNSRQTACDKPKNCYRLSTDASLSLVSLLVSITIPCKSFYKPVCYNSNESIWE